MNWPLIISNSLYTAIGIQAIGFILAAIGINMHFGFDRWEPARIEHFAGFNRDNL